MKTLLTLALAATLGVASYANASNENIAEMSSVRAKDKKIAVNLAEGMGKVKVSILDRDGKQLHQRNLNVKNTTKLPYDLSEMPSGEYFVVIENTSKNPLKDKIVYSVETTDAPQEYPLMAYGKAIDSDSFRLSVIGLDEPGVSIEIFDSNGKTIYEESIKHPEAFTKVYHLKNLQVEDVSLKVTDAKGRTRNLYL
jgi:hypothetical protein